jgi:hypothetical protein
LCKNAKEYIDSIEMALHDSDDSKRMSRVSFAQSHTWEASVRKLYDAISIYK